MATRQRQKAEKVAANLDRRPRAIAKNLGVSPSKVRIVLDLIRGKDYNSLYTRICYRTKY